MLLWVKWIYAKFQFIASPLILAAVSSLCEVWADGRSLSLISFKSSMTIPHEGSFNGHVTPNAIEQTSVVVHRVLSVDEMRAYAIGKAFHSS